MEVWVLKVEVNGEWEECRFSTRSEALAAFSALTSDYSSTLARAMLYASFPSERSNATSTAYIN